VQNEAERFGAPPQIGDDTAAILFLVVIGTRIPIGHAVSERVVEQNRNFAGGRRHGLRLAGTQSQPSVECPKRRITPADRGGCEPQ
jgi:hypothetical protein